MGPSSYFLFLMCWIIFTTSTIQIIAIIKSPKINISVPPQISTIGTIIIASKSMMPIMNNNVITLSPSFHYRLCRFREKEKRMLEFTLSQVIVRWFLFRGIPPVANLFNLISISVPVFWLTR